MIYKNINDIISNYKNVYKNNRNKFKKNSIFLLEILNKSEELNIVKIYQIFSNTINSLDSRFERYEALISIANNQNNFNNLLIKNRELFLKNLLKNDYIIDDIFQYNWEVKFIYTLYTLSIENNEHIIKHSEILCNRIFNIIDNLLENQKIETTLFNNWI